MASMWVGAPFCTRDSRRSTGILILILKTPPFQTPYDVVLLGGFSGRLDQTVHLLSYLHKLRKSGRRLFVVADENVGWVLDGVRGGFFFSPLAGIDLGCLFRVNIGSPSTTRY